MRIVVTGFEPFGGLDYNPSAAILDRLPRSIAGREVRTAVLPVDGERIASALAALGIETGDGVLHLGLARERAVISVERIALNVLDYPDPDNAGRIIKERPVVKGAPLALGTGLDCKRVVDCWREQAIPGEISNSAGTYLCNQLFYLSLERAPAGAKIGFLHLPPDERMALAQRAAYQPLAVQAKAVELAMTLLAAEEAR